MASLGGPRWRIGSADWQLTVDSWLRAAALIVVVIGDSGGLHWELERIGSLELARRLILVVPPVQFIPLPPASATADRLVALERDWGSAAECLSDPRVNLPRSIDADKARMILPGVGREAVMITSSGSDTSDYESALDAALDLYYDRR